MVTAFETYVELLARSEEKKARSKEKGKIAEREMIKAMLNECGERMTPEEKKSWSRKLMAMYVKNIQSNGASQGEGGGGLKIHLSPLKRDEQDVSTSEIYRRI